MTSEMVVVAINTELSVCAQMEGTLQEQEFENNTIQTLSVLMTPALSPPVETADRLIYITR